MWMVTRYGMFSAVCAKDQRSGQAQPYLVNVRARVREHIDNLATLCAENGVEHSGIIVTPPPADYQYRIIMPKVEWARIVGALAINVDYTNFKSECHRLNQQDYDSALMRVWQAFYEFGRNRWNKLHPPRAGYSVGGTMPINPNVRDAALATADDMSQWMEREMRREMDDMDPDHDLDTADLGEPAPRHRNRRAAERIDHEADKALASTVAQTPAPDAGGWTASRIQRRFNVGFNRALRIMDLLRG